MRETGYNIIDCIGCILLTSIHLTLLTAPSVLGDTSISTSEEMP